MKLLQITSSTKKAVPIIFVELTDTEILKQVYTGSHQNGYEITKMGKIFKKC